jgi:hypothetical protein
MPAPEANAENLTKCNNLVTFGWILAARLFRYSRSRVRRARNAGCAAAGASYLVILLDAFDRLQRPVPGWREMLARTTREALVWLTEPDLAVSVKRVRRSKATRAPGWSQ